MYVCVTFHVGSPSQSSRLAKVQELARSSDKCEREKGLPFLMKLEEVIFARHS